MRMKSVSPPTCVWVMRLLRACCLVRSVRVLPGQLDVYVLRAVEKAVRTPDGASCLVHPSYHGSLHPCVSFSSRV